MGCVAQTSPNVWRFVADSARKWGFSGSHYLVGQGADVNATDNDGNTPLHKAATDPGCLALVREDGTRISMLSGDAARASVAEYLVRQGADVHATNNDGNTPLHEAAAAIAPSVVEYLVGQGADVHTINSDGETPLDMAAGHDAIAAIFRRHANAAK